MLQINFSNHIFFLAIQATYYDWVAQIGTNRLKIYWMKSKDREWKDSGVKRKK